MKITPIFCFASLSLFVGLTAQVASASQNDVVLKRRATGILIQPAEQPALPSPGDAAAAASAVALNLSNIQGDILVGMKKDKELFFIFGITDVATFKSKLHTDIYPLITTTTQLLDVDKQPTTAINLAFSSSGLMALGVTDGLNDPLFAAGQTSDASFLGDPGTTNWVPGFVGTKVHGMFLLASDNLRKIEKQLDQLNRILGNSITEIHRVQGAARPGRQEGHEHFGFMDGISQPGVIGFTKAPTPGQIMLNPGFFLLGENGDSTSRPPWAKDGSFLAFRQLQQLVPEFEKFLADNPIVEPGVGPDQGSALLGARMVGRWKSGAPVDLAPLSDDPGLATDPLRNNDFTFAHPGEDLKSNQTRCPFAAHIRKTRPRADFSPENTANHIIRGGIPYGPEVTDAESALGISSSLLERGLAFVAYQSNIGQGFHFLQHNWANNPKFIFGKTDPTPGFDPIIGANGGAPRNVSGLDPNQPDKNTTLLTDFVVSRGGEYFFSPSLSAIRDTLSV